MIKEWFSFTRKERIAVMALLAIIAVLWMLPYAVKEEKALPPPAPEPVTKAIPVARLFVFNPNTATEAQWLLLGVNERTVRTILNYRNKGGRFRVAADLRKIWGLHKEEADRLIPYIRIPKNVPVNTVVKEVKSQQQRTIRRAIQPVNINMATAEQWKALPGIGDVLSARIVKFREKIGGFVSVEQVSKTYGLKDSVFRQLVPYLYMDSAQ